MKFFIALVALACFEVTLAANLERTLRPAFATGRIINGQEAQKGEANYIVSLNRGSHFCGGSIIHTNWVLTAAHCLTSSSFQVIAGLHSRNNASETQIRQVSSRKQIIVHENYSSGVGPYDIGLIYLSEPFNLNVLNRDGNASVGKISLPSGKYSQIGKGKLFGWGRDSSGALPNVLNTLDVNLIGYDACKDALPEGDPVHFTNICSYTEGKTDGSCNGDSGGPVVRSTNGDTELVGLVSWGYTPCAATKYPSVYTMVNAHQRWIKHKMDTYKA